ncbi:hypothetical protein C9374_008245 [Naegleria lovaniensis]|uniref:Rab-GAP TBC domain-containing protein n=1 Tax=Naegleria lovaniensis TaxID=51637 RepID=A0AA88GLB2_NAELO|nr:uncharacterized protein C9374_008245 [Naegleria lovaniensis]KAG2378606.1 hypothetical protein C9374_008245 [Naegleria lovaniensis]
MQHPIMNLFQSPSNNSDNPEKHSNGDLFNCESQLFGNVSLLSAPEASDSLLSLFNERETFAFEDCMYTSNNNSSLLHSLSSTGYNSWSSSSLGFDFQTSYSLDALSSDSVLSTPSRFETPLTKEATFPSPLSVNIIPLKNYRDHKSNMSSQMMAIQKDTFDQPSLESIAKNIETLLEDSFSVNDLNLMKELKKIENDVRSALIMKEHTRMMNSNNNNAGSSCSSSISASTPSIVSSSSSMKKDEHASHILTRSQAQKKKQSSSSRKNALPVLSSPQTKKRGKASTKRKRASADEDSESEKSSNSSNDSDSDFRPSSTENNECTTEEEEDEETEDDSKSSTTTTCKRKATSSASKSRTATPQPRKKRTTFAKADIALLTKWLHDHSNNPYPTDDEKKTLLECVNMTKDQLETCISEILTQPFAFQMDDYHIYEKIIETVRTKKMSDEEGEEIFLSVRVHDFHSQVKEFEQINSSTDPNTLLQSLCTKALSGNLGQSTIRSIIWRVFLGVLPLTEKFGKEHWITKIDYDRERYEELLKKHENDPRKKTKNSANSEDEVDVTFCDPLSQSQSNPWSEFFENSELEKTIVQDLKRLYPEYPFFRTDEIQNLLKRMLFVWSKENTDLSYRQGMHELLSPILLVVYRDAQNIENYKHLLEENPDLKLLMKLLDRNFLEHDAYCLFEKLMTKMREYFIVGEGPQGRPFPNISTKGPLDNMLMIERKMDLYETPIFKISNKIQNTLLEKKDPDLHRHLTKMCIEPQIYLIRWVRLLFGREFHIDDAIILWDAIFSDCGGFRSESLISASDIDLSLVEHISVAMLHFIRKHLLSSDSSYCMKRLMRYPPVEDVHIFVEQALESRARPTSLLPSMEASSNHHNGANNGGTSSVTVIPKSQSNPQLDTSSLFPRLTKDVPVTERTIKPSRKQEGTPKHKNSNSISASPNLGAFAKQLFPSSSTKPKSKGVTPLNSPSPSIHAMATSHHLYSSEGHEWIEREKKLGDVVDVVLNVLQNMALEAKLDEERLLMSVAELKHVRDCLKFQLPFQEREIDWIAKRLKSPRGSEAEENQEHGMMQSSSSSTTTTTTNTPHEEEEIKKSLGTFVVIDFHESPHPPSSTTLEPHFPNSHLPSSTSQHKPTAQKQNTVPNQNSNTISSSSSEPVFHPLLK